MIKKINIINTKLLKKNKNNIFLLFLFFKSLIIIFFSFLLIIINIINFNKKKKIKIKVCLCTLGKLENKYAKEFVEYYKNYGVDKIFIYDNNDLNGESFENVIYEYIKNNFVEIINYRGKKTPQLKMLNNCYNNNNKKFDWFIMYDMDEFIYLKKFSNIKLFLINEKFKDCTIIHLNRAFHTDNNQIHYKNISLIKRFPYAEYNVKTVKPIIKGHIRNFIISNQHTATSKFVSCNGYGQKTNKKNDFVNYYIKHFFSKSTEEFIDKINRGNIYVLNSNEEKLKKIQYYFLSNKITLEKIKYMENGTGIKLDKIRKKLIKLK